MKVIAPPQRVGLNGYRVNLLAYSPSPLTPDGLIRFVSICYRTAQYLARNIRKPLRTHRTNNSTHLILGYGKTRTIQRHGLVIPPTATCQPDLNQRLLLACQIDSYLSRFCHDTCGVRTADKRRTGINDRDGNRLILLRTSLEKEVDSTTATCGHHSYRVNLLAYSPSPLMSVVAKSISAAKRQQHFTRRDYLPFSYRCKRYLQSINFPKYPCALFL